MNVYHHRLSLLREKIRSLSLDSLFITTPSNILYTTGIQQLDGSHECSALITHNNFYVFVHSTFLGEAESQIKNGIIVPITHENPLSKYLEKIVKEEEIKTIVFEASDVTVTQFNRLNQVVKNITWKETGGIVEGIRQIKDSQEIEYIRQAAKITDDAFSYILPFVKEGAEEKAVALELELYLKKNSDGLAFPVILASGPGSASPHYTPRRKKIKKGEMILLDFGARIEGYCADMTRMVFIGAADEQYKKAYNTVLRAETKAIDFVIEQYKKGVGTKEIDAVARDYILSNGFPTIPHGVGHAVGIDIHEAPRLSPIDASILKPGMVFTIEPGIYTAGWGGIRIEDLFAWTDKDIEILSKSPKDLIEV